jgi:hypothetical protein
MSMESQIEALQRSLAARQLPLPRPPEPDSVENLDAIQQAIAPLRLPAEIVRFWQLVDPGTVAVRPWPLLASPEFALKAWRGHRAQPGQVPDVLFPVAYESHLFTFVELHQAGADTGGALWWYGYADSEFRLWFAGIEGLLAYMADALDRGHFERVGDWARIIDPNDTDFTGPPVIAEAPHPVFAAIDGVPADLENWPERWLEAMGLDRERRTPLGADATIAEVLATSAHASVRARIHARVDRLSSISGQGTAITVSDPTGSLRIFCPQNITAMGPRLRNAYEFEITACPDRPHPLLDAGQLDAIEPYMTPHAPMSRLADLATSPDAVAHDIRPVAEPSPQLD